MKLTSFSLLLPILILGCFASTASADTISITNASFETVDPLHPLNQSCGTGCTFNVGSIPGWAITGTAGLFQPSADHLNLPVPDGIHVAYSNGGTISQTLSAALTTNTIYTLSADVGHRLDGDIDVTNYTIALYAGSMLLNSVSGSNGVVPIGTFADESLTFTSGANVPAENLRIVLTSAGQQSDFDNVRLTAAPVPEPGTLPLLAVGLGLTVLLLRRR